jgi:hypothetical protein
MMKKVTYFLTVIFAVALMSTSCDPNEDPIVPDVLTVENLEGNWNFESLSFVDVDHNTNVSGDYNTVQELSDLNEFYDFVQIDLMFTTTTVLISSRYLNEFDNNVSEPWEGVYDYVLNGDIINVDGGYLEFEVMNSEALLNGGGVLELRLNDGNNDMPIGGTYTFN